MATELRAPPMMAQLLLRQNRRQRVLTTMAAARVGDFAEEVESAQVRERVHARALILVSF